MAQVDFIDNNLHPPWHPMVVGDGEVVIQNSQLRLGIERNGGQQYADAQVSDYEGLARRDFPWQPPLRLTVRARASHDATQLRGTAGFGFWNQPFMPGVREIPRLPRALWFFFASPPNDMVLAKGVPGCGWKAATIDTATPLFLSLLPFAPLGFLLMRIPALYRRLWPIGQRAIKVSESLLDVHLDAWHIYVLEWLPKSVYFSVDGDVVLRAPYSPRGPLGFITWIDNQYAVVTPQGRFKFGFVSVEETQHLLIDSIQIERLPR